MKIQQAKKINEAIKENIVEKNDGTSMSEMKIIYIGKGHS